MALSDKDIETVYFVKTLNQLVSPNDDLIAECAGTRLSSARIERIKSRIATRAAKLAAPFQRNASKKQLTS
jgi:hypothetical protein